jgi:uncharacterized alkaline shock family protein YloU
MSDFSADNRGTTNDAPRTPGSSTPMSSAPSPFGPLSASRGPEAPPGDEARNEVGRPQPKPPEVPQPPPFGRDMGPAVPGTEHLPGPDPAANGTARRGDPNTGEHRILQEIKGQIQVEDEVVEKVAALAAKEVAGVHDLGGDIERALESVRERVGIGNKRGDQGIRAKITGRDVSINVTIVIEYGYVVMDVARNVKNNVALQAHRMLGLRVVEVNVKVDDVKMPEEETEEEVDDGLMSIEG